MVDAGFARLYLAATKLKLGGWSAADESRRFHRIGNFLYAKPLLLAAYLHTIRKRSSRTSGVDRVTRECIERGIGRERWVTNIHCEVRAGYRFSSLLPVTIPKLSGGTRTIAVPALADRVVEFGLKEIIDAIFDPWMSGSSFGFRSGRGPRRALRAAANLVSNPRVTSVIEADVSAFYSSVRHDLVVPPIERRIADPMLLELIARLLRRAPVGAPPTTVGLAEGGAASPVLANIAFDPADRFLERHPLVVGLVRYADDVTIGVAGNQQVGEAVRREFEDFVAAMGLTLSPKKTFVRSVHEASQCLGHDILRRRDGAVVLFPSESRIQKLRESIETAINNQEETNPEQRIMNAHEKARGWINYYQPRHLAESIANAILGEAIERLGMTPIDPGTRANPSSTGPTDYPGRLQGLLWGIEPGFLSTAPRGGRQSVRSRTTRTVGLPECPTFRMQET